MNRDITARQIMTKEAILNALTVDMALGCSTNSMLHLPAIAHEIGFDFDIAFYLYDNHVVQSYDFHLLYIDISF